MNLQINRTSDGVVQYPIHTHSHYEIMYYLEGEGHMRTDEGDFSFSAGTVIIMPPSIGHGSASRQAESMLMMQPEKTILEIAYDCGFNNSSYFTSQFKKVYGFTPSQLRNGAKPENPRNMIFIP